VLTDGFPVRGLPAPGLAVWKGDRSAPRSPRPSVLAKVTGTGSWPGCTRVPAYDFLGHKGYVTPVHNAALDEHGRARAPVLLRQRGPAGAPATARTSGAGRTRVR
jgi:ribonuclease HII